MGMSCQGGALERGEHSGRVDGVQRRRHTRSHLEFTGRDVSRRKEKSLASPIFSISLGDREVGWGSLVVVG